VQRAIKAAEAELGSGGRLLIRNSGTEPVIRIMAESEDAALVDRIVAELTAAIERAGL
jgi:phosphoglucosamine mutase